MLTTRTAANLCLVTGALTLIALPGLLFDAKQWTSDLENRTSAPFPERARSAADFGRFTTGFEEWVQDHLGLREPLLRLKANLEFRAFNHSATPKVLLGRDGWLFYTGHKSLEDYTGQLRLEEWDLEAWYGAIRKRERWLHDRGIPYYFLWAPNKQSLYPDRMPPGIARVPPTLLDQVASRVEARSAQEHLPQPLIDTRAAMQAGRAASAPEHPLFHPIDVHWNLYGAYLAYAELARRIGQDRPGLVRRLELQEKEFTVEEMRGGDLASMMLLKPYPRQMSTTGRLAAFPSCSIQEPQGPPGSPGAQTRVDRCDPTVSAPKALVFHDSMIFGMRDYLSASFGTVRYRDLYPTFDELTEEVLREKPDVVIEERVERMAVNVPEAMDAGDVTVVPAPEAAERSGFIDLRLAPGSEAVVEGWAHWSTRQPGARLKVFSTLPISTYQLITKERPDVAATMGDARLLHSGFRLTLTFAPGDAPAQGRARVCVWTEDPTYGKKAPRVVNGAQWDGCPR